MDLTIDDALRVAGALADSVLLVNDRAVLCGEPIEFVSGWVFFYNSESFVKEGDFTAALVGNAPIAVFKSGDVRILGTAHPVEYFLERLAESIPNFID
jgi:Immunity protein 35